jgi:hypothetical protein
VEQVKIIGVVCIFVAVVCVVSANSAQAKTVYAITDHVNSTLRAYEIYGDQLKYQADVEVTDYATGAVDVTIDSQLELLFITYEKSAKIVWADAKTMEQKGFIDLGGAPYNASELAGIVEDEEKGLDLVISSCYNKFILLSAKILGIRGTFERERSES